MGISAASDDDIARFLAANPQWSLQQHKLHREYSFPDFARAFAFMTRVAEVAEQMNHHPEWFNVYNRVVVDLVTHDVRAISARDFELAVAMDKLFRNKGL